MVARDAAGPPASGLRVLAAAFAVLLASSRDAGSRPLPCPLGDRYLVDRAPLINGADTPTNALTVVGRRVAIGTACAPVPVRTRAGRTGTLVAAVWPAHACAGLRGRAVLRGRIGAPACRILEGRLKDRRAHLDTSFTAVLSTGCGDGVADPGRGEECDGGPCADGRDCTSSCTCAPTTSTTVPASACCGPERITLVSRTGTMRMNHLAPFPFPAGVITTLDSGPADAADCAHHVVVGPGGLVVPTFAIPSLAYCSEIVTAHCEVGNGEGAGMLWDGHAPAGHAVTNVTKMADTSDGLCNPPGQPCSTAAGGAGANTLGDVDAWRSIVVAGPPGVRSALDFRVTSRTWSDATCAPALDPACCATARYGDDTLANGELLISQLDLILSPTTDTATATFVDRNGDGCWRAGAGFPSSPSGDHASLTGVPAPGPCCVAGQPTTLVAVGTSFTGSPPLFDVGLLVTIPNSVAACEAYPVTPATCTVTTDPCLD